MLSGADQRGPEQERLLGEDVQPAVGAVERGVEAERAQALGAPVEDGVDAVTIHEAPELPLRRRPLLQVDEVRPDPALREEAERLARVGVVADPEDLDFQDVTPSLDRK
jgi:hypothetical protein